MHSREFPILTACFVFLSTSAQANEFAPIWERYLSDCTQAVTEPLRSLEQLDLTRYSLEQQFSVEDGNFVGVTIGNPESYTLTYFNKVGDHVASTCSAMIVANSVAAAEMDAHLRSLPDAAVVGGVVPVIIPEGNSFNSYPSHTWVVDLKNWWPARASLHAQHDGYAITITSFGSQAVEPNN